MNIISVIYLELSKYFNILLFKLMCASRGYFENNFFAPGAVILGLLPLRAQGFWRAKTP